MENLIVQQKVLSKLTFDLDFELGSVGSTISTLVDAQILLDQLVDSMDTAVYRGEERFSYHQHHRMIRVLSELFRYTVNDLSKDYEKAYNISSSLFHLAVEKN
ncbi:hypothetical protein [Bacillus sp. OK048]|uniref:hypothetical protein n=1 Tax=Bacillus sp. OK048 TaxID=1882761 RepID=UPI000890ECD6|nr:hypothetical protein [Bacillus sp. OK048]SDN06003.1 hypothetical protein SAMN05443253_107315 [Bacillus sp. OK048]